jgi:hypothetical protein
MNGQEPNFRKIDAVVLFFVTIVMSIVSYTHTSAFSNENPVQTSPARVNHNLSSLTAINSID